MLAWDYWLDQQWNRPSRTDCYLMALSCQVARIFSKNPAHIKPNDFRLEFPVVRPLSSEQYKKQKQEEAVEAARQRWLGFMKPMMKQ
jgi:hypothetical protein